MSSDLPTSLPGDMLRKAVQEYCELKTKRPHSSHAERLEAVAVKYDLSPLQCDFLHRHLRENVMTS